MKHLSQCERGKLCILLLALLCVFSTVHSQDYSSQRQQKVSRLDLLGLGETLFLNAGTINQYEIDTFRSFDKDISSKPRLVNSAEWQNLYERLIDTDMRPDKERLMGFDKLIETDPANLTKNNVVPIGIMNLEGVYLSGRDIAENEQSKKSGKNVDFSHYKKINILSASVLQENVYQADISFKLSPQLIISNRPQKISDLEIDFADGRGYKSFEIKDQYIPFHFELEGEHKLLIRFRTDGNVHVFETKVNVLQLERAKPFKEFQVFAGRITADSSDLDRSAKTSLVGGNVRIILGCDQILDKPVIIAEGIDLGQNIFLDDLEAKYRTRLAQFLAEGYDLVLLDYTDGRAAIQDNAQVLKSLIKQVNMMKSGAVESIVIGESMSGLVARWTLREMEQNGEAHKVKLLICYDTPHQGANVSVGLTQLIHEAHPTLMTQVILKFFAKHWRDFYLAFGTPAAKQLLLHWGGMQTGGVGSKHPDFDNFRTQLIALGNGGYPQNCRKIAITHGSMNAADRALFTRYTYGDRILRSWTPFGAQNTNIDLHTNQLNQNTNVLRFATWGIFSKSLGVSRFYNSPLNDDFLPGGRTGAAVPNKLFFATDSLDFCFVPTFSAIDYQGARDTQSERELLDVNAVNAQTLNRKTPFAAIYGNNTNTLHVSARNIQWAAIGFAEGLLTGSTACPALPKPPIPTIASFNTCYPFGQKRSTEDNTANITVTLAASSGGQYVHNWTVIPADQYFTTTGDQIVFQAERAGDYEVTCVRTYPNRRDLQSTFTTKVYVNDCNDETAQPEPQPGLAPNSEIKIADIWENDFLLTTAADSLAVFAHYTSGTKLLYASLANGNFVSRTVLKVSGMFEEFADLFPDTDPRQALPVTLKAFNATAEGRNAVLTWESASEVNSDHYEIERSGNGKDWEKIGTVLSGDLEFENQDYEFIDAYPTFRKVFYRLKMVDADSTFAYSRIQSLTFENIQEVSAFPNPLETGNILQLNVGEQHVTGVRIYNITGKLVLEVKAEDQQVNVQDLPVGMYLLKISLEKGTEQSRTFVKR